MEGKRNVSTAIEVRFLVPAIGAPRPNVKVSTCSSVGERRSANADVPGSIPGRLSDPIAQYGKSGGLINRPSSVQIRLGSNSSTNTT